MISLPRRQNRNGPPTLTRHASLGNQEFTSDECVTAFHAIYEFDTESLQPTRLYIYRAKGLNATPFFRQSEERKATRVNIFIETFSEIKMSSNRQDRRHKTHQSETDREQDSEKERVTKQKWGLKKFSKTKARRVVTAHSWIRDSRVVPFFVKSKFWMAPFTMALYRLMESWKEAHFIMASSLISFMLRGEDHIFCFLEITKPPRVPVASSVIYSMTLWKVYNKNMIFLTVSHGSGWQNDQGAEFARIRLASTCHLDSISISVSLI